MVIEAALIRQKVELDEKRFTMETSLPGDPEKWVWHRITGINVVGEYEGEPPFEYTEYVPPVPDPPDYGTRITPRAFLKRIPREARLTVLERASTNVSYQDYVMDLESSKYIDLEDPDTEAGLLFLVSEGLITETDVQSILTDRVTEIEKA